MSKRLVEAVIPNSWEIKKLEELSLIIMGQSPPSSTYNNISNGLPFFQGNADFGFIHPRVKVWCNEPKKIALPNDILVSVRAPVGAINIANVESCIGRGLSAVRVENVCDMYYLYYYLNHFNRIFKRLKQGSTFEAITKEELINFPVILPKNKKEQIKISSILLNIDYAAFITQNIIEKLHYIKKGLMHYLFTKGIGHTEFKETRLGKIPKDWEIKKIKDIGIVHTGKTPSTKNDDYWNSGDIPFITPGDINNDIFVRKTERFVSKQGAQAGRLLSKNSIAVVCIGSTIGKVSLIISEAITNQQINSIICKEGYYPFFIAYAIKHRRRYLKQYAGVAAVPIIKKSLFEIFSIAVPNYQEQKRIGQTFLKIDDQIYLNHKIIMEMKKTKKHLMQVLLTGKKRVPL